MGKAEVYDKLSIKPWQLPQIEGFTRRGLTLTYQGQIRNMLKHFGYEDRKIVLRDEQALTRIANEARARALVIMNGYNQRIAKDISLIADAADLTDTDYEIALGPVIRTMAEYNQKWMIPNQARWARQLAVADFVMRNGLVPLGWHVEPDESDSPPAERCQLALEISRAHPSFGAPKELYDAIPPEPFTGVDHPNCLVAGTVVAGPLAEQAFARSYQGPLVSIRTASGYELSGSPHHPVLTAKGWVDLGALREGDHVMSGADVERMSNLMNPDKHQVQSPIEQIARTVSMTLLQVPGTAADFHGDGIPDQHVDVILPDGGFEPYRVLGQFIHPSGHQVAIRRRAGETPFPADGSPLQISERARYSSDSVMRVMERFGDRASGHPPLVQSGAERPLSASGLLRKASDRLSGLIALDQVVEVRYDAMWFGHLYNFSTHDGWYFANHIIVSNCPHFLIPSHHVHSDTKPTQQALWDGSIATYGNSGVGAAINEMERGEEEEAIVDKALVFAGHRELEAWAEVLGLYAQKDWDESKHPRDDHGRFSSGGGFSMPEKYNDQADSAARDMLTPFGHALSLDTAEYIAGLSATQQQALTLAPDDATRWEAAVRSIADARRSGDLAYMDSRQMWDRSGLKGTSETTLDPAKLDPVTPPAYDPNVQPTPPYGTSEVQDVMRGRICQLSGLDWNVVNNFQYDWTQSSSNRQGSIALQAAASELLGQPLHGFVQGQAELYQASTPEAYADRVAQAKEYLIAQYQVTQDYLAAHKIDYVDAYRGVAYTSLNTPPPELAAIPKGEKMTVDTTGQPLRSWSLNRSSAIDFASNAFNTAGTGTIQRGYLLAARIPRNRILALQMTGLGPPEGLEHELIVLGGPMKVQARDIAESHRWNPKAFNPDEPRDEHGRWTTSLPQEPSSKEGDNMRMVAYALQQARLVGLSSDQVGIDVKASPEDQKDQARAYLRTSRSEELAYSKIAAASNGEISEQMARNFKMEWDNSVVTPFSISIVEAAREKFGLPQTEVGEKRLLDAKKQQDRVSEFGGPDWTALMGMSRSFVDAQYSVTQDMYAKAGYSPNDLIDMYRGSASKPPDGIQKGQWTDASLTMRAATSWTANALMATGFAGVDGYVVHVNIPVKDILATPVTGLGVKAEREYVVLGGARHGRMWALPRSGSGGIFAGKTFNPDEPRDDHGRWTGGSGGATSEAERQVKLRAGLDAHKTLPWTPPQGDEDSTPTTPQQDALMHILAAQAMDDLSWDPGEDPDNETQDFRDAAHPDVRFVPDAVRQYTITGLESDLAGKMMEVDKTEPDDTTTYSDQASRFNSAWGISTSSAPSLAMQEATAQMTGGDIGRSADDIKAAESETWVNPVRINAARAWAPTVVQAQYQITQQWYRDHPEATLVEDGKRYVPLTRGIVFSEDDTPAPFKDVTASVPTSSDGILPGGSWQDATIQEAPLKSWTSSVDMAVPYARNMLQWRQGRTNGYVIAAKVPVERILANPATGMTFPEVAEHIVIGGGPMAVKIAKVYDAPFA